MLFKLFLRKIIPPQHHQQHFENTPGLSHELLSFSAGLDTPPSYLNHVPHKAKLLSSANCVMFKFRVNFQQFGLQIRLQVSISQFPFSFTFCRWEECIYTQSKQRATRKTEKEKDSGETDRRQKHNANVTLYT